MKALNLHKTRQTQNETPVCIHTWSGIRICDSRIQTVRGIVAPQTTRQLRSDSLTSVLVHEIASWLACPFRFANQEFVPFLCSPDMLCGISSDSVKVTIEGELYEVPFLLRSFKTTRCHKPENHVLNLNPFKQLKSHVCEIFHYVIPSSPLPLS
jgi:hypothetical protein